MRLNIYYKQLIRKELLLRYHYNSLNHILKLSHISISIVFKEESTENIGRILECFDLLGLVTGQRALISKRSVALATAGGYCILEVTLRGLNCYRFMDYLVVVVLPLYLKRYGFLWDGVGKNSRSFSFILKDLNVFFNLHGSRGQMEEKVCISLYPGSEQVGDLGSFFRAFKFPIKSKGSKFSW